MYSYSVQWRKGTKILTYVTTSRLSVASMTKLVTTDLFSTFVVQVAPLTLWGGA